MIQWRNKFDQSTLARAQAAYQNKKVVDFEKIQGGYRAAVLGRVRNEVSVRMRKDGHMGLTCTCPVARGGKSCEHMAAVLCAVEQSTAETDVRSEETAQREEKRPAQGEAESGAGKKLEAVRQAAPEQAARKDVEESQHRDGENGKIMEKKKQAAELKREQEKKRLDREMARQERRAERNRKLEEQVRQEEARRQKVRENGKSMEKKEQEAAARAEAKRRKEEQRKEQERLRREKEEREREEQERREEEERQSRERRKEEYTLLGESWAEESPAADSATIARLEKYSYFDGTAIRESMEIPEQAYRQGRELISQGMLQIQRVLSGYERNSGEIKGQMDALGKSGREQFPLRMIFSRQEITGCECGCPRCRRDYYIWNVKRTECPYKAGALAALEEYLNTHNIGDATDQNAQELLNFYHKKKSNSVLADAAARKGSLKLLPRLVKKDGGLSVSFKIGESKLFIVKKLDEFIRNVKDSATGTYGARTQFNHDIGNFTQEGRGWVRFISQIVREENEFQQRLLDARNYYYYRSSGVGSELNLFGWRLDEFYKQLGQQTVEYEDRDGREKHRDVLACDAANPRVTMRIVREEFEEEDMEEEPWPTRAGRKRPPARRQRRERTEQEQFHGIRVEGTLPELFFGTDTAYYIGQGKLFQVEKGFLEKIEPLANLAEGDAFSFEVGRNHLSEFYHRILPELSDIVDVTETEPELFRSYLLPDVRFVFYLDAEEKNVTCRACALYGHREVSLLDSLNGDRPGGSRLEPFRDVGREDETLSQLTQLLPQIDWQKQELHCGGDENLVYQMMESGTDRLMELGEVHCTKRFLGYHAVKPVKVSVGVSVSSGLLELDIATQDIPRGELLDLLNSYRAKKKYYRLKDGSFVSLSDSSLEMLSELMDAARLKPRDFVEGKMHLPMYRTLYLDRMLEENDSVYSSRDSHFRKVVKGFKTVKDADFEEPESLSRVMRKYQKNGYKWLRTLEMWQFGGILADDMGLGKTLQVISVLLAARQEKRQGTSLVVAPASLVFNWGEEFARFAPELKVSLITGTQQERQEKIGALAEADVLVTSYDLLKRDIHLYEGAEFLYEIIDEAQYIKNHTTAAAKAVKVVKSRVRYALTGTPIENRLSELWSIFDYLMPGFLYGYDVFKKEMETPIVKNRDEAAMKRLQKMVGPFILRRLKEDVLRDLPEKLEECRYVRLGQEQQRLYDGQVIHMRERIAGQSDEEFNKNRLLILAELMRLRQICCDPSLCFENYRGEVAKLEACMELIRSAMDGGHRMLVFSQFTSMLEILHRELDAAQIPFYTITGSTSKEKRLQLVKEFNEGDTPVFLISLKAGGVGLNLTGADVVIHYDPWWNLAVQNQATDRAHRIGQTRKVTVYKLIVKNTIEEKIQKLQEAKRDLADQIISGDAGQTGSLSREEIMELLEL